MKKANFYHPELDVLRFAAFFAVFIHHSLPQNSEAYSNLLGSFLGTVVASVVTAGGLGVDLFFCLSSFLITKLLIIEHQQTSDISIKAFYVRRILRIWPLYVFFMLLTILLFPLLLKNEHMSTMQIISFLFFFANWACAFTGYPSSVAAPLWSVSIEEQFYLTWPILLKWLDIKNLLNICVSLLIISFLTRGYLVFVGSKHPAIWCNTIARFDPIAVGAIFALYYDKISFTFSTRSRVFLFLFGYLIPVAYLFCFGDKSFIGKESILFYPLVAFASIITILAVIQKNVHLKDQDRFGKLLVHLGRISYGLYVYHVFSIKIVNQYLGQLLFVNNYLLQTVLFLFLSFVLTVLLADVTYRWLEIPFLSLKKKFTKISSAPVASA